MTSKRSSEILILTKSVATKRVFPRMSFIALTLQKAVLFHFNASSCSNFSVIAFQSQTCPGLLEMILLSWLSRKNLRHISPRTHGSIICNRRSLRDIIEANKIATKFLRTKNKSWEINYLYCWKKTRERDIAAPIKRDASSWCLTLRFDVPNFTARIRLWKSFAWVHIVPFHVNRIIIDRFDVRGEKLLLPFCCLPSIIGKYKGERICVVPHIHETLYLFKIEQNI